MTDNTKFPPEKNFPAGYQPPKVWTWRRAMAARLPASTADCRADA